MAEKKKTTTKKTTTKTASKRKPAAKKTRKPAGDRSRTVAAVKALEEEDKLKLRKKKLLQSEILAILILSFGVFFALSITTTACGKVGENVNIILKGVLGPVAYVLPFFMIIMGVLVFAEKTALITFRSILCTLLLFVFLCSFVAAFLSPLKGATAIDIKAELVAKDIYASGVQMGGIIGVYVAAFLLNTVGTAGLYIITVIGIVIMTLFIVNTPVSQLFDDIKLRKEVRVKERDEQYQKRLEAKEEELARAAIEAQKQLEIEPKNIEAKKSVFDNLVKKREIKKDELPSLSIESIKQTTEDINSDAQAPRNISVPSNPAFDDAPASPKSDEYEPEKEQEEEINKIEIPREYEGENITENKRQILDYVANDELFGITNDEENEDILEKYGIPHQDVQEPAPLEVLDTSASMQPVTEESPKVDNKYKFPPMDLLKKPGSLRGSKKVNDSQDQARLLEDTLQSFGVSATVLDVVKGPAVTRFEVQPAPGVQVSKIVHLQDDIALNLRAKSIRMEAPIPGKAAVGIEVSNDATQTVLLRELVDSSAFKSHKSKIAVTLGKSISGENIVCDIHEMPHLLIAGTTGSGKSVCIDSMLVSLLYHAKPDEVKLILIDPKIVELTPFNGIPHLLIPVVTEPNKAAGALNWAVNEMNDRYNKFAEEGVKELKTYNESVKFKGEADKVMPEIVIVIDELADLIMAAKNAVEDSICRLAQKARAAGMHLIIATQRPSADVITGVIKANIPSRIALSVSSQIDSRVILDMGGAENLLGKGDMLYSPQSLSKPIRIQGTYISDDELHAVIDFVKNEAVSGSYNEEILTELDRVGSGQQAGNKDDDTDELFMDALETVVRAGQCSVSLLQRRFRIGYNRSARIVDMMEERGMVGPSDSSSKGRKVLMTVEEFEEYVARTAELENK